jgi:exodeoxyribonuclease VII large subunit
VLERRMRDYRHELRHLTSSDRLMSFPRRIALRRAQLERFRITLHRRLEAQARLLRQAATFEPRIVTAMATRMAPVLRQAATLEPRIASAMARRLAAERHHLARTAATLQAVSPLSVLSRGYAIAFSRTRNRRKPIMDSAAVNVGDAIEVQLKRGRLECTVDSKTMGVESLWPVPVADES